MSSRIWRRGRFVENVSGTVVFLITILFFDFRRVRDSVRFELPFPVNMTAEQFCLRWNNHQRTLISVFDGLFESGTLVDCTLAADGQYLKAHKVVLCACSPYLEALLSQHYNQHPIVILKDVKFEELQAIMEYMYRGEVNVTQEQLGHFLKAAEMLQVKGLTYSENKPGGASAQIVSSKFSAAGSDSDKNASVVKPHESKKKEKVTLSPATGSQSSLVDSLKLLPSKLVIDIPPISPVNNAKDGSVSPKRKKLSYSGEVKSSSPGNKNSESAANDQSSSSSSSLSAAAAGKSKFVFEVDPMETEFNAQNIKVEEFSDDSYDSDTLVVDEDNAADGKQQEPGPSGAVADGWKALVAQGDDHPEATKGGGVGGGRKIDEFLEYLALEPKGARKLAAPGAHPIHKRKLRKRKQLMAASTAQTENRKIHKNQHQIKFKTTANNKSKMALNIRKKIINYKLQAKNVVKVKTEEKDTETNVVTNEAKENIGVKVVAASALKLKIDKAKMKAAVKKSSTALNKKGTKNKMTGGMSNSMNTTNGKIYGCDNCDKSYSRKSSLYRHTTYECGKEHSFHCPYCAYGAYQKVHLQRHISILHNRSPV